MNVSEFPLFRYRGTATRIIDGDTLKISVDLGLYVSREITVRIADINVPEVRGETASAGWAAAHALRQLVEGRPLYLETRKDTRSFDRWIATLWIVADPDGELTDVGAWLVAQGYAEDVA